MVEGQAVNDNEYYYICELVKMLLIKKTMDIAIKDGNGSLLSIIMKHMMLQYHHLGYKNYALACLEHVAQVQLFLASSTGSLCEHLRS